MILVPDWQALLFVPVGADRHLASAIRLRPDAIILDLEDAIAPAAKILARHSNLFLVVVIIVGFHAIAIYIFKYNMKVTIIKYNAILVVVVL